MAPPEKLVPLTHTSPSHRCAVGPSLSPLRAERDKLAPLLVLAVALVGCAPVSDYRPAVDLAGTDAARFESDLRDCQKVAARDRYGPVLARLVQGATIGAALGAVAGGYAGNIGLATSYGAIAGTIAGGGLGVVEASHEPFAGAPDEKTVVEACLRNNGYGVTPVAAGH